MCLYLAESIATCFMPIKNLYCIVYFSRWWLASSNISVKFCFRACFPGKQNMIPSICRLLNLPRVCLLLKYWQSPYYRPLSPTLALLLFNFYCIHVFFFFWFGFYGPFKNISLISSRSFIEGGRKPENPEKNHLTIRKQNLAFPHMTRARLEPQRWET